MRKCLQYNIWSVNMKAPSNTQVCCWHLLVMFSNVTLIITLTKISKKWQSGEIFETGREEKKKKTPLRYMYVAPLCSFYNLTCQYYPKEFKCAMLLQLYITGRYNKCINTQYTTYVLCMITRALQMSSPIFCNDKILKYYIDAKELETCLQIKEADRHSSWLEFHRCYRTIQTKELCI